MFIMKQQRFFLLGSGSDGSGERKQKYICTHNDSCIDSLNILFLIKEYFEYLFGTC